MGQTVNVVDNFGLDPSGNEPINGTFESAVGDLSNTRIEFPSDGTFTATEAMSVSPNGPVELIGNGATIKADTSDEMQLVTFVLPPGSLIEDFTFDMTSEGAILGWKVITEGTVRVKDITVRGFAPAKPSGGPNPVQGIFAPVAESSSATIQIVNYVAIGGSAAGTHDDNSKPESAPENRLGSPWGIWVGSNTQGTIQLVNSQLRGWSNGVYGGRTPGTVEVRGGTYWNNLNAQLRLGGGSVIDGATLVLDDRQWSMEDNPGPYSLGENQGVHAVRVDAKNHGNTSDPIRLVNVEVQAKSMNQGASVIEFESASGPGIIENSQIMNHLDRPVIRGGSPNAGVSQSNIVVKNSYIGGKSPSPVMEMNDRPQSRIEQSCIEIPDPGPDDIIDAEIGQGVRFGSCKGRALSAPGEIGSDANVSSLPAPNVSIDGSNSGAASRQQERRQRRRNKKFLTRVGSGIFSMFLLIVLFVMAGFVGLFYSIFGNDD